MVLLCDRRPPLISSRNSGTSGSFGVLAENDDKHPPPDVEALDAYALERWEVIPPIMWSDSRELISRVQTILYYMVSSGTGQFPAKPSQGVLYLLQRSGLMASVQYVDLLGVARAHFLLNTAGTLYKSRPRGSSFSFTRHMNNYGSFCYNTFRWRR